ncbi:MAG: hypothetical protein RLZZ426_861 [Actinomycetota bacterium]
MVPSLMGKGYAANTRVTRACLTLGAIMAEKSPAKNSGKTAPAKSLKEKRADKKNKAAGKLSSGLDK